MDRPSAHSENNQAGPESSIMQMVDKATGVFSRRKPWIGEKLKIIHDQYFIFIVFTGKLSKMAFSLFFQLEFGLLNYLAFSKLPVFRLGFHGDTRFSFLLGLEIHETWLKDQTIPFLLNDGPSAWRVRCFGKLIMNSRINHFRLCLV